MSSTLLGPTGRPLRRDRQKEVTQERLQRSLGQMRARSPRKIGDGPAAFSLCVDVEIQPFRWDTNSFYRRLGLTPGCDRIEIARAFNEAPRPTSEADLYYTTAAKNLLKKDVRRRYDSIPLGSFFGDDPDLDDVRLSDDDDEALVPLEPPSWSIYADPCVDDAVAKEWDPSPLRTSITAALSNWARRFDDPRIGLGLTNTSPRWEMVGNFPVLFFGVDSEVTEEYIVRVANAFIAATETTP